jgi:GT2 family glycosyltransferase
VANYEKNSRFKVGVLIACHNRKAMTLNLLTRLFATSPNSWEIQCILADDSSTDGTLEAVQLYFPSVKVIRGDGYWYWARSMYEAEKVAGFTNDALLWLNNDIELYDDGLSRLFDLWLQNQNSICVGQFRNRSEDTHSYGGFLRFDRHPLHLRSIHATTHPKEVDTFNGNAVFIPREVSRLIGHIDGKFSHGFADIDFGLRAGQNGIKSIVCPGYIGVCENNPKSQNTLGEVLRSIRDPKRGTLKSQIRFFRRHGNFFWPIFLFTPFIKAANVSMGVFLERLIRHLLSIFKKE